MTTLENYKVMATSLIGLGQDIESKYSINELGRLYHEMTIGNIEDGSLPFDEDAFNYFLDIIKKSLSVDSNDTRVDELINAANVFAAENGMSPVTSYDGLKIIIKDIFNEWKSLKDAKQNGVPVNTTSEYDIFALKVMNKAYEDRIRALEDELKALRQNT